ncbi:hypothetical protein OSB04_009525 [Centaurea solstitialis]|uniref:Reverse transcriptase zinc-binding domain-containing protein n=1 Tax=Centaurea solstitialis TaxID=347529 RepID=A0AA38TJ09_9ASTR|nr:hypothetical protein OSB04_009525 [Centaurea solstitialis]
MDPGYLGNFVSGRVRDKKGYFSVKHLTRLLMESHSSREDAEDGVFWSNLVPKKINIFIWRLLNRALPTRLTLSKRGIVFHSLDCIRCEQEVESPDHCFFSCSSSNILWKKIWAWWDIKSPCISSVSALKRLIQHLGSQHHWGHIFLAVCFVTLWSIWNWRNSILFAEGEDIIKRKLEDHFAKVQTFSKLWISSRSHKVQVNWSNWVSSPRKP